MSQNEKLSQAEIDALLNGKPVAPPAPEVNFGQKQLLTADECDGVGEIGNISFGSAATALSILLSQRVEITTPQVKVLRVDEVQDDFPRPYVVVTVEYTAGLSGLNALAIEINDAKIIADLMMGGDGTNVEQELNELHLSAVSEAMNQMMGGAATAMSTMFQRPINISPPVVKFVDFSSGDKPDLDMDWVVNTSFRLRIGQLVDSRIMQWVSVPFAKEILRLAQEAFEGTATTAAPPASVQAPSREPERPIEPQREEPRTQDYTSTASRGYENPPVMEAGDSMTPPRSVNPGGHLPPNGYSAQSEVAATAAQRSPVQSWQNPDGYWNPQAGPGRNDGWAVHGEERGRTLQAPPVIQRPQFQDLDDGMGVEKVPKNLSLLFDVQLTVTVELGRTKRPIREILELGPGSVVELDKLAGEPVDILVNNKRVAIGEVVVIDENFGVRVTDILSQADRVRTLQA